MVGMRQPRRSGVGHGRLAARAGLSVVLLAVLVTVACSDDADEADDASGEASSHAAAGGSGSRDGNGGDDELEAAFVTRPDLTPPVIEVGVAESPSPGRLFLAPKRGGAQTGPLIADDDGEVVWSLPTDDIANEFRVQTYRGEPVLTWYEGPVEDGYGRGEFVIADTAYQEVARVTAGNGLVADHHEFQLTDDGTALLGAFEKERADLSDVGGPADGWMLNCYVQEVDIATGEVLFQWSAHDHVPMSDSLTLPVPDAGATEDPRDDDGSEEVPYDWFHINSVAEDGDDTLLVSARHTSAIYAIDRRTGDVRWTLGGKSSDFRMGAGTTFVRQHDARRLPDGTISLFDNQAYPPDNGESRGLVLALDERRRTASLVREWTHPDGIRATSQANMQVLDDGGAGIGWGSIGRVTEFDPDGDIVFDAAWEPANSYRVYRHEWTGRPATRPDVAARPLDDGAAVEVHMSWNGATEVAEWRVLGGPEPDDLRPVASVARDGFETTVEIDAVEHVAVEALDDAATVLAGSDVRAVGS